MKIEVTRATMLAAAKLARAQAARSHDPAHWVTWNHTRLALEQFAAGLPR